MPRDGGSVRSRIQVHSDQEAAGLDGKGRTVPIVAFLALILVATATAGCLTNSTTDQPEENDGPANASSTAARERAREALDRFPDMVAFDGPVSQVRVNLSATSLDGTMTVKMIVTFGSNDALRVETWLQGTPSTVHCNATRKTVRMQNPLGNATTKVLRQPRGLESCLQGHQDQWFFNATHLMQNTTLHNATNESGEVIAQLTRTNETGARSQLRARVQAGRVTSLSLDSESNPIESTHIEYRIRYDDRHPIELPPADVRQPPVIDANETTRGQIYEWRFDESETGTFPLDEFEVRVYEGDIGRWSFCDPIENPRVASFNLTASQHDSGFAYNFSNANGKRFGYHDSFQIKFPIERSPENHTVLVWDKWADLPIDARCPFGAPAVSGAIVAGILMFTAAALSRRGD